MRTQGQREVTAVFRKDNAGESHLIGIVMDVLVVVWWVTKQVFGWSAGWPRVVLLPNSKRGFQ